MGHLYGTHFHQQLNETALTSIIFEGEFSARREPRRTQLNNTTRGASNLCLQNPPVRLLRAASGSRTGNHVIWLSEFEGKLDLDLPTNCSVASWMWLCARDVLRETRDVPRSPRTPVAGSLRQGISMWCSPATQLPGIKIIAMEWAAHALDTRVEIRDPGR